LRANVANIGNLTVASCTGCGGDGGANSKWATSTDNISIYASDAMRVGIGTTTPQWLLQLSTSTRPQLALHDPSQGATNWTFRNAGGFLYLASSSPFTNATGTTPALTVLPNGNIGINTATPASRLHIVGASAVTATVNMEAGSGGNPLMQYSPFTGTAWSSGVDVSDSNKFKIANNGALNTNTKMTFDINGNAGIGTTTPRWLFQLSSSTAPQLTLTDPTVATNHWSFRNVGGQLYFATSSPTSFATSTLSLMMIDGSTGNVGIGTTTPGAKLNVIGALCVDDSTPTCANAARAEGTIYSVAALSATLDLAESYPTKDPTLGAGEIVMLDNSNEIFVSRGERGSLMPLVGIVSTAPGFWLGGFNDELYKNDKKLPIALSGRVPTKVNDEGGTIQAGDRIALSSVAGVGKKAANTDYTVGIALESMSGSTDTVEVFVSLSNPTKSPELMALENRVNSLELNLASASLSLSTSTNPSFIESVLEAIGATVADGITYIKNLAVEMLTVGKSDKPTGITFYDTVTGVPYCFMISNGVQTSQPGACTSTAPSGGSSQGGSPAPVVEDPVPQPAPAPELEPEPPITPEPDSTTQDEPAPSEVEEEPTPAPEPTPVTTEG